MSKILTFLTNDNKIIQQIDGLQPPQNSFAIITENYDILDMAGNYIRLQDRNNIKMDFLKKALKDIHEDRIRNIAAEITKYRAIISDLELLSQKSSNQEYEKYSEDANRYIEKLNQLNNELLQLTSLYESKNNRFSQDRSRSPPMRDRSNSPQRVPRIASPRRRMVQNACTSSALIHDTGYKVTNINGWDENAIETVRNWRILFKENKYIYE